MTQPVHGSCHCGAIRVSLTPSRPLSELPVRSCTCGFCRRHGAVYTSDAGGRMRIEAEPGSIVRYRFGQGQTDFLICRVCGGYVAATAEADTGLLGVVNIRGLDLPGFEDRTPEPMDYEDESPDERLARRNARWTPAVLLELQSA